ncbi:hypothetical protein OQA88_8967 [Cercophora sp. LCS_1]
MIIPPQRSAQLRFPSRLIAISAATFLILLFLWLSTSTHSHPFFLSSKLPPQPEPAQPESPTRETIPNTVHFVYILPDPTAEFSFQFSHFLSIFAANYYFRPTTVYLHTNADATGPAVTRARDGSSGKWTQYIFTLFHLRINTVPAPTHTTKGTEITHMEHRSDFVRVKAVCEFGGIYMDWDVHALRDIAPLRSAGFRAIAGRELGGQLNSGTFMAVKESKLIKWWMVYMNEMYNGGWATHSNGVLTVLGQRMVREEREMLILDREAFAPGSWLKEGNEELFGVHGDAESLGGLENGEGKLPGDEEGFFDRWHHPERFPGWAKDWSSTYLLHAFSPERSRHKVTGFEHVTPRYVLERRSNFARAVYPVAKIMFEEGLIQLDDTHLGL